MEQYEQKTKQNLFVTLLFYYYTLEASHNFFDAYRKL